MQETRVIYKVKSASEEAIYQHLLACDEYFKPALSKKVDICEYSKKIFDKAITFEAWHDAILSGMVAVYCNDANQLAFITNVSVMRDAVKAGIASQLMKMCIEYCFATLIKEIILEVNSQNTNAIELYKKFNFNFTGTKGDEIEMKLIIVSI
jgi:ribosomal protein S18 acetylase RimI-like enzyme